MTKPSVLIAPVGSKPQLVTIALDLLQQQGEDVQEVIIIHTTLDRPTTRLSVTRLGQEFPGLYHDTRLRLICLCDERGTPTERAAVAAKLAKAVLEEGMPDGVSILSVNVPVGADPGKVALTKPLDVPFWKALRNEDGSFILVPWALAELLDAPEHTDVGALRRGYISITPIRLRVECDLSALEAFLARAGLVGA